MAKSKGGVLSIETVGALAITAAVAVGIFLPWYGGVSLFSAVVAGLGASGSLSAFGATFDFSAMSNIITFVFVLLAMMTVGSIAFGVRMIVTSLGGRTKGMTPCGVLIFVIAVAAFGIVAFVGGIGAAQIGLWLCLAAGLASLLWGIFA